MSRSLKSKLDRLGPSALSKLEAVGFDSNRMRRSLPPLQTLVAFEAAARLNSFTLAGTELNLTQPAISQQVKLLEYRLGVPLFRRSNNQIILTEQGEQFSEAVGMMLNALSESVHNLRPDGGRTTLTVSLLPSFASTWFATRSGRFILDNPQIDLIALSTVACTGFGQEGADVAIRWGPGGTEDLYEEILLDEHHMLVASTELASALGPAPSIEDLKRYPFVHDTNYSEWQKVIEGNGGDPDDFREGLYFGDAAATLTAIAAGHGAGVVRDVVASHLLASGQIARLPFKSVKGPHSYFFLCPNRRLKQARVQAFLQWLRSEAATS
ncbi:LysR substrate-binding domain-containing protein [uncultured Ruegeria sp.]|uniref:LysR substrate-binding domain-containing protein n=1 Tax=uncultured Ruegeria sp. TaxID=259304 RepID=UPI00262170A9|nr:LysR substrate-binding domain-containing protein [uncultured Ruegeria sp.]